MKRFFCLFILIFSAFFTFAQNPFRVMFYNTENLFDTIDNPQKNDNEFLPSSAKYWNSKKYWEKLNNLAKVITAVGEWDSPVLIGLCEVENSLVLNDLTKKTPLKAQQYRYEVTNCRDTRGVNVALLYQRDRFKYLDHRSYAVYFPKNNYKKTRDILHVTGEISTGDTLDVFVCHLPSRRGGEMESDPDRRFVASIVKNKADSLMRIRQNPYIIIMGDMNDEPSNNSMRQTLKARPIENNCSPSALYNLFYHYEKQEKKGSYKYGRQWNMLDQIIVSGTFLCPGNRIQVLPETALIFSQPFMMTEDKSHGGKRPKKSFHGMKYEAGFSDHLPVYVDFSVKKTN